MRGTCVRGDVEETSREFEELTSRRPHGRGGVEGMSREFEEMPMSPYSRHMFCYCETCVSYKTDANVRKQ